MKFYTAIIWFFCLFLSLTSCGKRQSNRENNTFSADSIHYAEGFTVKRFHDYIQVDVLDPWHSGRLLQRYFLVPREKAVPQNLLDGTVVRVPIRKVVVYTAVHASIISQLGETDQIVGVCEPQYIECKDVIAELKKGQISDLGEATAPNIEKIIGIGTETILASPFENSGFGQAEKIGVPIVQCADYMESLPLGRAEWIKFYGMLFCQESRADSIFKATEQRYKALCDLTRRVKTRPTVIAEKNYGSTWFIPAGESYTARMYVDAGANYIFHDLPGKGGKPMSFEEVLDRGIHADVWMIKYNSPRAMSYEDLKGEYSPYSSFDAFKKQHIFTCNTGIVPYYEDSPMNPDLLLSDFIWIFHPELLPSDYHPYFYFPMAK